MNHLDSRLALLALATLLAAACTGRSTSYRATSHPASSHADSSAYHAPGHADDAEAAHAYGSGEAAPTSRPGLGTRFGERVVSQITEVRFMRESPQPFAEVALFYNDADGAMAQARHRGAGLHDARAYTPHGGLSVALTDTAARLLPGFTAGGRTYVVGEDGGRYNLVVRNDTGGRYEVVASVDGLDVIDGLPAGLTKRGYVIEPYSTLVIDGFRTSRSSVAAFRFGAVADSYAARTGEGRNVGVIGFAFFAERGSHWTSDEIHRRETADPFPDRFARPPGY